MRIGQSSPPIYPVAAPLAGPRPAELSPPLDDYGPHPSPGVYARNQDFLNGWNSAGRTLDGIGSFLWNGAGALLRGTGQVLGAVGRGLWSGTKAVVGVGARLAGGLLQGAGVVGRWAWHGAATVVRGSLDLAGRAARGAWNLAGDVVRGTGQLLGNLGDALGGVFEPGPVLLPPYPGTPPGVYQPPQPPPYQPYPYPYPGPVIGLPPVPPRPPQLPPPPPPLPPLPPVPPAPPCPPPLAWPYPEPLPRPWPTPPHGDEPGPGWCSYTVRRGDSLAKIAREQLGNEQRWPEIFLLNRDAISDPNLIHVGLALRLPQR